MTQIRLDSAVPRTHRVAETRQVTPQVRSLRLEGTLGARPGQFVMVWVPGVDEFPLSVVADDGTHVTLAFFPVGPGTEALAAMQPGDLVGLHGPYGTHFDASGAKRVAVVGGGFGAAPLLSAAKAAKDAGAELHAVLGAKTKDMLLFRGEIAALKPASVAVATDDGSEGFKGVLIGPLEMLLTDVKIDLVLACGPDRMLIAVSDICHERGVKAQLSVHRYMKCGTGVCGTCVVGPAGLRLCTEGPVITNDVFRSLGELREFKRDGLGIRHAF